MSDKVINIFSRPSKADEPDKAEVQSETDANQLRENIRLNEEKKEKAKQERLKANKSVLKSYRIKN